MEDHLAGAGFGMFLGTQNWAPGKQHFHRALLVTLKLQDVLLLTGDGGRTGGMLKGDPIQDTLWKRSVV